MNKQTRLFAEANEPELQGGPAVAEFDTSAPPDTTPPASEPATPPPAKTDLSEDAIRKIASSVAEGFARAQPKAEPEDRQLSPEEIRSLLNEFDVNEDLLKELGYEDVKPEMVKGYAGFVEKLKKNFASIARVMLQAEMQKVRAEMEPLRGYVAENQRKQYREQFFKAHGELEKYEPIVRAVASQVSPTHGNGQPKTVEEAMDEIAKMTKAVLSSSGINLSDSPGETANRGAGPKMPKLAGPGRSSTSGQAGQQNNPDAGIYKGWNPVA
jgi:hypothetical protein